MTIVVNPEYEKYYEELMKNPSFYFKLDRYIESLDIKLLKDKTHNKSFRLSDKTITIEFGFTISPEKKVIIQKISN